MIFVWNLKIFLNYVEVLSWLISNFLFDITSSVTIPQVTTPPKKTQLVNDKKWHAIFPRNDLKRTKVKKVFLQNFDIKNLNKAIIQTISFSNLWI